MSVGRNLQEMENVVTKGAAPADPMKSIAQNASGVMIPGQTGAWEDLGGPTPENYRPDDNSATLKTPGATLAQVRDVVNAKAAAAEAPHTSATPAPTPGQGVKEENEEDEDLVDEEEYDEDEEVVAEAADEDEEDEDEEDEDEDKVEEEFDIEEDVNALLEGEDLSEEFQEKARTIFEAAIRSKVADIKEELQETYENALIEEVQFIKEELTERLDSYLEYVADEWIQENALAIEHGLKTEMTESFLQGMKSLFEDHYVSIPEDRYDVIESMVDKLDEMEEKLNEQIE
ncbi:MAG: Prochlorococcus phage, partial [Actinomycetota bacterium]